MTSFCIVITSDPLDSEGAYSAHKFVTAVLESGNSISGIFFYQAGVNLANRYQMMLSDERCIYHLWSTLAEKHQIPLQVCVTAANRRGVLSIEDAKEQQIDGFNLQAPFESVGIGELMVMLNNADRSIQF